MTLSVCRAYEQMKVKHEPLTLIPPNFETPLPPLQPAVSAIFCSSLKRFFCVFKNANGFAVHSRSSARPAVSSVAMFLASGGDVLPCYVQSFVGWSYPTLLCG